MNVTLQVVGLFYNVNLVMPDTGQTVQSLMDAAIATPNPAGSLNGGAGFNYVTHVDGQPGTPPTMSAMSVYYQSPFQSRVLANTYPAGVYSLAESFDPSTPAAQYSVWQYYMFDAAGAYVSPSNISESFTTQSLDGIARVTWRLVTILGGPTFTPAEAAGLAKRNPAMRVAPSM